VRKELRKGLMNYTLCQLIRIYFILHILIYPGEDKIIPEMLIHAGSELKDELHKLMKQIWEEESIPLAWKTGLICRIHKKGYKSDCNNYRGISLLNIIYKIVTRIMQIAEDKLGEYQCGFRKGRSTYLCCVKHKRNLMTMGKIYTYYLLSIRKHSTV
jgi:hypothetical protein